MYIIKQEGLYQNEVTVGLVSILNCKIAYLKLQYPPGKPRLRVTFRVSSHIKTLDAGYSFLCTTNHQVERQVRQLPHDVFSYR